MARRNAQRSRLSAWATGLAMLMVAGIVAGAALLPVAVAHVGMLIVWRRPLDACQASLVWLGGALAMSLWLAREQKATRG